MSDIVLWLEGLLTERWISAIKRNGLLSDKVLNACRRHGVCVQDNVHDGDYLLKSGSSGWGCDAEVAISHKKGGKNKDGDFVGSGPFDLVRDGRKNEFLEYAAAFHSRSQLYYSPRLKARAGVKGLKDSEILQDDDKADVLGILTSNDWQVIVRHDVRVEVLEIAEREGILGVRMFIDKLAVDKLASGEKVFPKIKVSKQNKKQKKKIKLARKLVKDGWSERAVANKLNLWRMAKDEQKSFWLVVYGI